MKTFSTPPVAIRQGELGAQANYFATPGASTYFGLEALQRGDAQAYSIAGCRILDTADERTAIALLQRAIAIETNQDIRRKLHCALSDATGVDPFIDYHLADEAPLLRAARELGFDGLTVWENDDAGGPTSVLLAGDAPVQAITRAQAQIALARQQEPDLPVPSPERVAAIEEFDARLFKTWGVGLDEEQAAMLCSSDTEHISEALDDWEARLGIEVDDLAHAFGVRIGHVPGA